MRGAIGFICIAMAAGACSDDSTDPAAGGNAAAGGSPSDGGGPAAGGESEGGAPAGGSEPQGGEGGRASLPTSVPDYFRMTGAAQGTEGEVNVDCTLDLIFELQASNEETARFIVYPGTHGGEVWRTLVDDEGAGFSFHADVFGEVVATLYFEDGRLDLAVPINETAENAFFQQMALFQGTLAADGTASGDWRCAPLETTQDGYEDLTVWVDGTWTTEPIED